LYNSTILCTGGDFYWPGSFVVIKKNPPGLMV